MRDGNNTKISEIPKYDLDSIKLAFNTVGKLTMTASAMQGQYEVGFNDQDVVDIIQALTDTDFYKSMPPVHSGFTAWQDVYRPTFKNIALYVKFQTDNRGEVILSFKSR